MRRPSLARHHRNVPVHLKLLCLLHVIDYHYVGLSDERVENSTYGSQAHALFYGNVSVAFSEAGFLGVERRDENRSSAVQWRVALHPGKRRRLPDNKTRRLSEQRVKV